MKLTEVAAPGRTTGPRVHLDYLDGLRALAALTVVGHHVEQAIWTPFSDQPPRWFDAVHFVLPSGRFAVGLFIVISGFCLMLPVVRGDGRLRGGAFAFFARRARRILPTYYLALAVTLVLIATVIGKKTGGTWDVAIPPTASGILSHVFLVQNWAPFFHPDYAAATIDFSTLFAMKPDAMMHAIHRMLAVLADTQNVDPPTWSVAVEWQIYLLFPALVWSFRRIGPFKTVLLTLLTYLFYFRFHALLHLFMCPHFVALFAMGMLGAQIAFGEGPRWERMRRRRGWGWTAFCLWGLVFFLNVASGGLLFFVGYLEDLLVGVASVCLLVTGARVESGRARTLFAGPRLVFLGTFSYSIYLLHMPLLELVRRFVVPATMNKVGQFYVLALVGIPFVCAAAYAFYWYCERPFMNARNERSPGSVPEHTTVELTTSGP